MADKIKADANEMTISMQQKDANMPKRSIITRRSSIEGANKVVYMSIQEKHTDMRRKKSNIMMADERSNIKINISMQPNLDNMHSSVYKRSSIQMAKEIKDGNNKMNALMPEQHAGMHERSNMAVAKKRPHITMPMQEKHAKMCKRSNIEMVEEINAIRIWIIMLNAVKEWRIGRDTALGNRSTQTDILHTRVGIPGLLKSEVGSITVGILKMRRCKPNLRIGVPHVGHLLETEVGSRIMGLLEMRSHKPDIRIGIVRIASLLKTEVGSPVMGLLETRRCKPDLAIDLNLLRLA